MPINLDAFIDPMKKNDFAAVNKLFEEIKALNREMKSAGACLVSNEELVRDCFSRGMTEGVSNEMLMAFARSGMLSAPKNEALVWAQARKNEELVGLLLNEGASIDEQVRLSDGYKNLDNALIKQLEARIILQNVKEIIKKPKLPLLEDPVYGHLKQCIALESSVLAEWINAITSRSIDNPLTVEQWERLIVNIKSLADKNKNYDEKLSKRLNAKNFSAYQHPAKSRQMVSGSLDKNDKIKIAEKAAEIVDGLVEEGLSPDEIKELLIHLNEEGDKSLWNAGNVETILISKKSDYNFYRDNADKLNEEKRNWSEAAKKEAWQQFRQECMNLLRKVQADELLKSSPKKINNRFVDVGGVKDGQKLLGNYIEKKLMAILKNKSEILSEIQINTISTIKKILSCWRGYVPCRLDGSVTYFSDKRQYELQLIDMALLAIKSRCKEIYEIVEAIWVLNTDKSILNRMRTDVLHRTEDQNVLDFMMQIDDFATNAREGSCLVAVKFAAKGGNKNVIERLSKKNDFDVNAKDSNGMTAAMHAAINGHKKIVEYLSTLKGFKLNEMDNNGMTVVMYAELWRRYEIVERLFRLEDFDLSAVDRFGKNAIERAVFRDDIKMLKILSKHEKFNLDAKDKNGQTAAMYAVRYDQIEIFEFLSKCKDFNVNETDSFGQTLAMYAVHNTCKEILESIFKFENFDFYAKDKSGKDLMSWISDKSYLYYLNRYYEEGDLDGAKRVIANDEVIVEKVLQYRAAFTLAGMVDSLFSETRTQCQALANKVLTESKNSEQLNRAKAMIPLADALRGIAPRGVSGAFAARVHDDQLLKWLKESVTFNPDLLIGYVDKIIDGKQVNPYSLPEWKRFCEVIEKLADLSHSQGFSFPLDIERLKAYKHLQSPPIKKQAELPHKSAFFQEVNVYQASVSSNQASSSSSSSISSSVSSKQSLAESANYEIGELVKRWFIDIEKAKPTEEELKSIDFWLEVTTTSNKAQYRHGLAQQSIAIELFKRAVVDEEMMAFKSHPETLHSSIKSDVDKEMALDCFKTEIRKAKQVLLAKIIEENKPAPSEKLKANDEVREQPQVMIEQPSVKQPSISDEELERRFSELVKKPVGGLFAQDNKAAVDPAKPEGSPKRSPRKKMEPGQ